MADSSMSREKRRRAREYEARKVVHELQEDRRRRDNRIALIVLVAVAVIALGAQLAYSATGGRTSIAETVSPPVESSPTPTETAQPQPAGTPPPTTVAEDREWVGTLALNGVALGITIDGVNAPQATSNFIDLAQRGFYADVGCHRLTTEGIFVLQCGDPTGTGTGGPGYTFGPLENLPADGVYPAGTIAMARAQAEDSQGSQFFIVYEETRLPAPGYTVFGHVTSGLDELKSSVIEPGVDPAGSRSAVDGPPLVPVEITGITLE